MEGLGLGLALCHFPCRTARFGAHCDAQLGGCLLMCYGQGGEWPGKEGRVLFPGAAGGSCLDHPCPPLTHITLTHKCPLAPPSTPSALPPQVMSCQP